jgi:hypothetical protein
LLAVIGLAWNAAAIQEKVVGIEHSVTQEEVGIAVKFIGAALCNSGYDPASIAPRRGIILARLDDELLQGVRSRNGQVGKGVRAN